MATKKFSDEFKEEVRAAYMSGSDSLAVIADRYGMGLRTLEQWSKEGGWAAAREAERSTKKVSSLPAPAMVPAPPRRVPPGKLDKLRAEGALSGIDELVLVDHALVKVSNTLMDSMIARDIGTCASALCKLIELRLELKPRTAAQLAEMAIELGVTPAEFVAELKRHWAHERAA